MRRPVVTNLDTQGHLTPDTTLDARHVHIYRTTFNNYQHVLGWPAVRSEETGAFGLFACRESGLSATKR